MFIEPNSRIFRALSRLYGTLNEGTWVVFNQECPHLEFHAFLKMPENCRLKRTKYNRYCFHTLGQNRSTVCCSTIRECANR